MGAFERDKHKAFIRTYEYEKHDLEHYVTQHLRLSGIFWGLHALALMGAEGDLRADLILELMHKCRRKNGGYAGNSEQDAHVLHTLSAVQVAFLLRRVDVLDADAIVQFVEGLQNSDGSFRGDEFGETDTRFTYCALSTLRLLGRLEGSRIDVSAAVRHVFACRNADGAFGSIPGAESHAGQTFCALAALAIAGRIEDLPRADTLALWLGERQVEGGGTNGRPEKAADACYAWWVAASLAILGRKEWLSASSLREYILKCQNAESGGMSPRIGEHADIFHTHFAIAALALFGTDGLLSVDPIHCLPTHILATSETVERRCEADTA